MWGADGRYRYDYPATRTRIVDLLFDTEYWIRVGTCATATCDNLDDVAFAAEFSFRTVPDPN